MDRAVCVTLLAVGSLLTARVWAVDAATTAPAAYECRWTDAPITIDGKADEEAWKNAQTITDFRLWWKQGDAQRPHTATKARLLWDRDYLYFFAEMEDTDLYSFTSQHQGALWEGDVFEVFLKPAVDKG